ncbi:hypothetical protein VNO80_10292 [Phaseolus coccineus]|uniref:Uncharacterized protein n=1 Tax=Phaseolus coccineus TaxID=3886 RepID=A0AAN9RDP7_PHACN
MLITTPPSTTTLILMLSFTLIIRQNHAHKSSILFSCLLPLFCLVSRLWLECSNCEYFEGDAIEMNRNRIELYSNK